MGKTAIVFSGQGAQYSGMGKSLYETSPAAKKLYDLAETLRPGTLRQSFEGTSEELSKTANTQPCLYLVDICAALALREMGICADAVAGFSLGELAALAYSGAFTPEEGFEIVMKRSELMQKASEENDTAMAAVLKLDSAAVEEMCSEIEDAYPVNYNSPVQTVVAGTKSAIAELHTKVKERGARAVDLAVSAAFHSPFMDGAAAEFADFLSGKRLGAPNIPLYANSTSLPYGSDTFAALSVQMNSPVRWCSTIQNMIADGFTTFIEAGAGKTLCGLIKKISSDVDIYSVEDAETLRATVEAVRKNA